MHLFVRKGVGAKDDSGPLRSFLWGNCRNGGTKDMASHLEKLFLLLIVGLLLLNCYSEAL